MAQHFNGPALSRRSFFATGAALAAVAGLGLSGCGGDSGSSSQGGSGSTEIRCSASYQTENFLPLNNSTGLGVGTNWNVVEGLYMLDMASMTPYAALADGEPTQENDTTFVVKMRSGAKFSDGTDVTATDVQTSYERTVGAEGSMYAPMLSFISKVEATDASTVTITTTMPVSMDMLKNRLPLILVVPQNASDEELTKKPIGSGPWMYDQVNGQDGGQITFLPNPNYNGQHPALATKLTYDIIIDDTARTSSLTDKTTAIMENVPSNLIAQASSNGAVIEQAMGFAVGFMMFNTKKKPFDDVRVRQAFLYAIDYDKMIMNALPDVATRPDSFLPATHKDYMGAASVDYKYDKDKAAQLLADAGVSNLSIQLDTTDAGWIVAMAPQIQSNLKDLGIDASINTMASGALYSDRTKPAADGIPPFDVVLAPGDPGCFGTDPDLLMNWWYGDNTWTQERTMWKDSEGYKKLHQLMDQAFQASGDEQKQLWKQCFDVLSEEVPLYPVVHRQVVTAFYNDMVKDFEAIGTTGLRFLDVAPL